MQMYVGRSTKPLILFSSGLTFEIGKQTLRQRTHSSEPEMPQVIIRKMNARKSFKSLPPPGEGTASPEPRSKPASTPGLQVCRKFRISELAAGHSTWEEPCSP